MTFMESISMAQDTLVPDDYIRRVKHAVRDELSALDPAIQITDTQYFNHSAIPDFVVSWPNDRDKRNIYLRDSYASVAAAEDLEVLDADAPMLLTLKPVKSEVDGRQSPSHGSALLTDPAAIDSIAKASVNEGSPLGALVRANFIRGAKGLIDEPRASRLVDLSRNETDDVTASSLVSESFTAASASRISRTAYLIDLAFGRVPLPSQNSIGISESELASRDALSAAEIEYLIPWLLRHSPSGETSDFWDYVGGLMTFADLERIKDRLEGLDLDGLIRANSRKWTTKRAYLGIAFRDHENPDAPANNHWSVMSGAIGINVGEQRLLLSSSGNVLRGRDKQSSVLWSDLAPALREFRLTKVELRGITRSVSVNAEQSDDVRDDIDQITQSLNDHYFVAEVGLRFPANGQTEDPSDVRVNLGNSLITAEREATLADLAAASLKVLGHRTPVEEADLNAILSEDRIIP